MSGPEVFAPTPRMAITELIEVAKKERGKEFYVERMGKILRYLEKARFHDRPLLDEPMSMSAIDAVLKEAWYEVQCAPDPIETMIRDMAVQGRA